MLLKFSVSNFRSFKDKSTLDMVGKNKKTLNTAVVLGANASGKSNFFKAIYISSKFINNGKIDKPDTVSLYDTFLKNDNPVTYSFIFEQNKNVISFSFSIKNKRNYIMNEKLRIGSDIDNLNDIYKRNEEGSIDILCQENNLCEKINSMKNYFSDMGNPKNVLFLTTMLDRISETTNEIKDIKSFFETLYASDINAVVNSNINVFSFLPDISKIIANPKTKENLIKFLKVADNTVKNVKVSKLNENNTVVGNTITHDINGKDIEVSFLEESGGIRMFSSLFSKIDSMLKEKRIYIIDELDTRLHYDLLSYIVKIIDNNRLGSQIIFTCHNIGSLYWNIKNECFHIVEKEEGNSKILRADAVIDEANKDERIKAYMQGKLGGFPDYELLEKSLEEYSKDKR